ncbi:MAG: hypothetical protein Q8Q09_06865 [Deltaproteobacteria bacterium]|nr:hypothetical protein [Deltaproteobacteria bacterium]
MAYKTSWLLISFLGLVGCATTQTSSVPAEYAAEWNACLANVEHWCEEHAHGDQDHAMQCRRESRTEFAALSDASARTAFLRSHGCTR